MDITCIQVLANTNYEFINKWLSILLPAYNKIQRDVVRRKTNKSIRAREY